MPVPNDVTVTRQVLAEPDAALRENTWATLADGTPLVTAARRGKGLIVLFHVTGDTRWSDLPLSGRSSKCSSASSRSPATPAAAETAADRKTKTAREAVAPSRVLDGFGIFTAPPRDRAAGAGRLCRAAPRPTIRRASTARRRASLP